MPLAVPLPPPRIDDNQSPPSFVHAARLDISDGTWAQVPHVDEVIAHGVAYAWTGDRVVSPYVFDYSNGGENSGGATEPTGGYLNIASGEWAALPEPSAAGTAQIHAVSPTWMTAGEGLVLDVERDRWLPLNLAPGQPAEAISGAWIGDQLVTFGGGNSSNGTLTNDSWLWRPAA